jgi:hypothetical protein
MIAPLPLTLLLCAIAGAQESPSSGMRLVGSAQLNGKALRLTPAENHKAGAAWSEKKQPVAAGFETTFEFQLTEQGGLGPGADGFAFVIQNAGPNAIGNAGSAGGFALGDRRYYSKLQGIPQSIAVFFDTFYNPETNDPSDNYVGLFTAGRPNKMRWPPSRLAYSKHLKVNLKDGEVHQVRITFHPPLFTVFLDSQSVLTSTVDLSTVVDSDGDAYTGFTASTGGGYENHDIRNWNLRPDVSSSISVVSSSIEYLKTPCLPDRNLCTPERPIVEQRAPETWHVILPAHLTWSAAIPNPSGRPVTISNAKGLVCWNVAELGQSGCNGPEGNPAGAGRIIQRTVRGRTEFSIDDRTNNFRDNEGYFEFEVSIVRGK